MQTPVLAPAGTALEATDLVKTYGRAQESA